MGTGRWLGACHAALSQQNPCPGPGLCRARVRDRAGAGGPWQGPCPPWPLGAVGAGAPPGLSSHKDRLCGALGVAGAHVTSRLAAGRWVLTGAGHREPGSSQAIPSRSSRLSSLTQKSLEPPRTQGPMDGFSTKSLALQAQRKLLGAVPPRAVAALVDDASSAVLDELYGAAREFTRSRKEAQKLLKNLVKVAVKLGLLLRGGRLGADELALLQRLRERARRLAMTALSFRQVDFTFDRRVLAAGLLECRDLLQQALGPRLSAKSHGRISHVFGRLADGDFLAALYGPAEPYRSHLRGICEGLERLLEDGSL
nr:tumor necrosis factor alpha-induced protein 8-like protein 1 isoform X2 [Microcebus murinus]